MKFLLAVFVVASFLQLSLALFGYSKNNHVKSNKYRLHREPPLDHVTTFQSTEDDVEEKWITQRLNNFDPQDLRTWQMRYMENRKYLVEGGPIFIDVGGEWTISKGWLMTGHMHDMTVATNGTMFYTEHRYYGQSRPTPDLTNDNLRYLNVDQALADLAHFIVEIKEILPEVKNSRVFLVGGSYSATMVTWFMQKYPHLAVGAWSSSAPLEAKVDFVEYKEVVSEALEKIGGSNCTGRIRRAFEELEGLVARKNTDRIEEIFRLCWPLDLNNQLDVWTLFADVAGSFSGIVQYYRAEFGQIERECEFLVNSKIVNDMEALADWWWYDPRYPNGTNECYDHRYYGWIADFNGTSWDDISARYEIRQWFYQTCAEYGWYQSSGSDNILFGSSFPVESSMHLCYDFYHGLFNHSIIHDNAKRTNVIYGAKNPAVRNVYSTHGEFDPWRPMGVQENINEHSPTVILPGEAHCADLYSVGPSDTEEMLESKAKVFQLAKEWLGISS